MWKSNKSRLGFEMLESRVLLSRTLGLPPLSEMTASPTTEIMSLRIEMDNLRASDVIAWVRMAERIQTAQSIDNETSLQETTAIEPQAALTESVDVTPIESVSDQPLNDGNMSGITTAIPLGGNDGTTQTTGVTQADLGTPAATEPTIAADSTETTIGLTDASNVVTRMRRVEVRRADDHVRFKPLAERTATFRSAEGVDVAPKLDVTRAKRQLPLLADRASFLDDVQRSRDREADISLSNDAPKSTLVSIRVETDHEEPPSEKTPRLHEKSDMRPEVSTLRFSRAPSQKAQDFSIEPADTPAIRMANQVASDNYWQAFADAPIDKGESDRHDALRVDFTETEVTDSAAETAWGMLDSVTAEAVLDETAVAEYAAVAAAAVTFASSSPLNRYITNRSPDVTTAVGGGNDSPSGGLYPPAKPRRRGRLRRLWAWLLPHDPEPPQRCPTTMTDRENENHRSVEYHDPPPFTRYDFVDNAVLTLADQRDQETSDGGTINVSVWEAGAAATLATGIAAKGVQRRARRSKPKRPTVAAYQGTTVVRRP